MNVSRTVRTVVAAVIGGCAVSLFALPDPTAAASPRDPAPQARQVPNPPPPPTGTASLTVQVVASDSGSPIRGARVLIYGMLLQPSPAPASQGRATASVSVSMTVDGVPVRDAGAAAAARLQKEARTDQSGACTFTDLPAALYSVNVMPPSAFVRGAGSVPATRVADGASAKTVVRLDRGGVVAGRVFDDFGEPLTGARVTVYRQQRAGGASRTQVQTSGQQTNDLGQFRVWGLQEGEYVVAASQESYQFGSDEAGVKEGLLPTYYPGVAAIDGARAVSVKPGQETGGVDFQLVPGRLGTVSGRATDSSGSPLSSSGGGSSVYLSPRTMNPLFGGRGAQVRPDGTFLITGVPPGDYYVNANRMGPPPAGQREGAFVPVSVNGDEVTVNIQTNTGATISGRVVYEGVPPATPAGAPGSGPRPSPARVMLQPATVGGYGMGFSSSQPGDVRPDGTFEMTGVRGVVQFAAMGGRAALKAVTLGARNISGQPLELLGTERLDNVVVVMTYDTGGIDGTVNDEGGEPVSGATVVVFPDDSSRWSAGSPFVHQYRTSTQSAPRGDAPSVPTPPAGANATRAPLTPGAFSAAMLPAGRYAVVAFPAGTMYLAPDQESLARWRESATIVTVSPGQTTAVQLSPVK